jgi:hypothetical protein
MIFQFKCKKVCNALHARRFAEIYLQWFGVALLNVWGFGLGQMVC